MPRLSSTRQALAILVLVTSCLAARAQAQPPVKPSAAIPLQTLPAAQPTRVPESTPYRPAGRAALTTAQVQYTNGRLAVLADNSSLNQILRDISRQTGIKITGGVADERVFGSYGPADPSRILATLLDGTGSNMLLIDGAGSGSRELILTPRNGGITPAGASGNLGHRNGVDESDLPPEQRARRGFATSTGPVASPPNDNAGAAPAFSPTVPTSSQSSGAQAAAADDSPAAPASSTAPAADTTQQQSPNGVKTPQQIYDQLIQLQQQAKPQ